MLKFNTFRASRYLRSKFVEGKFLLASEGTDLELEILDLLRKQVKNMIGDVALQDAWKVEKLSDTQLLIKPGEAWFKGLPFSMRGGKDQLVSGAVLSIGTVPVGTTIADDSSGNGKVITFGTVGSPNNGDVTPANTYRILITAREELITDLQDEFLQNANLTESTQQKVRLIFQLNIVPESIQDESPIPYRDENSVGTDAGLTPTNFPDVSNDNQPNFVNQVVVTPQVGSGDLVSLNSLPGAEQIDGRDLELIINNPVGANPIPDAPSEQAAFNHGKLIDSNGSEYHINFITNDTVSGRVKIVIDKEFQQEDPVIDPPVGRPYTLIKRDVFVTDDTNGVPLGKLHWPIATLVWSNSNGIVHESSVTDLRTSIDKLDDYIGTVNTKFSLKAVNGGTIDYNNTTSILNWSADITLLNPHGPAMTISSAGVPIVDGGSLMYDLDLDNGGALELGTLAVNITSAGTTNTLDPVALGSVKVGNIIVDSGGVVAEITAIDDVNDTITTNTALSNTGTATVYLDSFGPGKAPLSSIKFCLASRTGAKVYIAGLELEDGESGQIGDGASQELLTFIGSTGDADDSPNYTSENFITDGDSLVLAISTLDAELQSLSTTVANISWKAPVADFASLPAVGNVDGDVRLVLDTRVAYHWKNSTSEWLPLTGTGGGIKIIGGGTVSWDLSSENLSFTANMFLEKKGLAYTDNTIPTTESPINLANDKDVAYVQPNLSTGGPNLTITVDTLANTPLTAIIIARRDGNNVIVGSSSIQLKDGESKELYRGLTDQEEDKLYGQKSSFFRSDNPVTWTGTEIQFTTDIVLEMLKDDGTEQTYTVLAADSPITLNNGEYAYLTVDRTQTSQTLSFTVGAAPAEAAAGSEVVIFGKRQDVSGVGYLHLPLHKQVLVPSQSTRLGAGSFGGTVKTDYLDPVSTSLPTGTSVTIDGVAGVNGDLVLFTNLASNNNRIYELGGVGVAITWTAITAFNGQFDPTDGDVVRVLKGDAFSEQAAIFDGTDFKVNDVIRLFDGVSANFWELGSIKNSTLTNNSLASVFEVTVTGSENIVVSYSITRSTSKETGQLYITSDGTTAQVSRNASFIGDVGVEFTADIDSGNLRLRYSTTDTGNDADMKYFLKRWSDSLGGPTGVPNYTGATGGSVSAAGVLKDIQYHGAGGLLAGDNRFQWDNSGGFLDLNGQEYTVLSSGATINDNQVSPALLFSYAHATYSNAIIDYSIERNGERRTGTIHVAANSSDAANNDSFVETGTTGVTLDASINGANVEITYTSTSTGFSGTFKYVIRRWS